MSTHWQVHSTGTKAQHFTHNGGHVMYIQAEGQQYARFLDQLHSNTLFDWYLEIGCRTGRTFAPVRSKTIAVDPYFQADINVITKKPALHVFQTTSDAFFETGFLKKNGIKLSFSFLDGMHLFEFLLRDFINTEANSVPGGVIAMHDCCPSTSEMTTRDWKSVKRGGWTGDVWKLIPILQEFRPNLKLTVLNCRPTGLVLVSGLDPKNTVLTKNYDKIINRYTEVDLDTYEPGKFFSSFSYENPREFRDAGYPLFSGARLSEDMAINPELVTP